MKNKIKNNNKEYMESAVFFRSKPLNFLYIIMVLSFMSSFYIAGSINPEFKALLNDVSKGKISILMTVDGLITTSTFAFIAFISISPSSSGSSMSMNRIAWKGVWVYRYPILLIFTVILTMSDCFLNITGCSQLVFIGTIFSGLILLIVIYKYSVNNKTLNKKSAKKLVYILLTPYNEKDFKNSFRNLVHPLRGSTNIDFIKEILIQDPLLKVFRNDLNYDLLGELEKVNSENDVLERIIINKFSNVLKTNNEIPIESRMKLGVWIFLKINDSNKLAIYDEDSFNYFASLLAGPSFIVSLKKDGTASKKSRNYKLFKMASEYYNVKLVDDSNAEEFFDKKQG